MRESVGTTGEYWHHWSLSERLSDGLCFACPSGVNMGWCESRVKLFRSKASRQWGGSMFGATSQDSTPAQRNPRLWAQSQRQAREMMDHSARSRELPPPKLKRNTVLGGR